MNDLEKPMSRNEKIALLIAVAGIFLMVIGVVAFVDHLWGGAVAWAAASWLVGFIFFVLGCLAIKMERSEQRR